MRAFFFQRGVVRCLSFSSRPVSDWMDKKYLTFAWIYAMRGSAEAADVVHDAPVMYNAFKAH